MNWMPVLVVVGLIAMGVLWLSGGTRLFGRGG